MAEAAGTYLDANATLPLRPEARAAMLEALDLGGNPSSIHRPGRAARQMLNRARAAVGAAVSVGAGHVVFTSGATEANAWVLAGSGRSRRLIFALEHDSVRQNAPEAEIIPATAEGLVDLSALQVLLQADAPPALVSIMAVNNEIGTIQPLAEVARLCHRAGALLHVDAAQALGKIPVNPLLWGAQYLTLSAHKAGGPPGIGAVILSPEQPLTPLIRGGGQESRRRAGTENLPGIAGFAAAVTAAVADLEGFARLAYLRDAMEARFARAVPEAAIAGRQAPRVANTSCLALPGLSAETQVMRLDLAGYAVSAGSACSSGKVTRSPVLLAMGWSPDLAGSAIRVSLPPGSDAAAIAGFESAWLRMAAARQQGPERRRDAIVIDGRG